MTGRGEEGQAGGIEALVFGVLVFVVGTLLIANTWTVIDAKMAAGAAAREAARTFVEASGRAEGYDRAGQAAREAIRGYGRDPAKMTFPNEGVALERCATVTMTVGYRVGIVALPLIGRLAGTVTVSAAHSEIVDPYRSGLPGGSGATDDPCGWRGLPS